MDKDLYLGSLDLNETLLHIHLCPVTEENINAGELVNSEEELKEKLAGTAFYQSIHWDEVKFPSVLLEKEENKDV